MDTFYTFLENITYYKTESVHFWGLMNSATKIGSACIPRGDGIESCAMLHLSSSCLLIY